MRLFNYHFGQRNWLEVAIQHNPGSYGCLEINIKTILIHLICHASTSVYCITNTDDDHQPSFNKLTILIIILKTSYNSCHLHHWYVHSSGCSDS